MVFVMFGKDPQIFVAFHAEKWAKFNDSDHPNGLKNDNYAVNVFHQSKDCLVYSLSIPWPRLNEKKNIELNALIDQLII